MGKKRKEKEAKPYSHDSAKRTNIPTEQDKDILRDSDTQAVPYSPEPAGTTGPKLSWRRGQNIQPIKTDALPLYIHEKISPSAFFQQLTQGKGKSQGDIFTGFNGLPQDAKYDWYKHQGDWSNRIIRGNSVDVMASLAVKEEMTGKVQMVYFDPPYGINFDSNYQPNSKKRGGGQPQEATSRKAFRDTYMDGVHSYMDCIYNVAAHARMLLTDTGSFFLQIGTENVNRVGVVLDEVFGAENRVAMIAFAKTGSSAAKKLPQTADWLLWYAKDEENCKYNQLFEQFTKREDQLGSLGFDGCVEFEDGTCRSLNPDEKRDLSLLPGGARLYRRMPLFSMLESTTGRSGNYEWNKKTYRCPANSQWRVSKEGLDRLAQIGRLDAAPNSDRLGWKRYEDEFPGRMINNLWQKQMSASDMHYVVETAELVLERCILMTTDPGDLVMDTTCGSGTTALVAERWGRRWITIDSSAIPVALCRQRILSALHKWYLLQDEPEGQAKETELASKSDTSPQESKSTDKQSMANPKSGFVYERVRHVSAATLAYDKPPKSTLLVDRPIAKKGVIRISSSFTVESHSPYTYVSPTALPSSRVVGEREIGIRENLLRSLKEDGIHDLEGNNQYKFVGIENWLDGDAVALLTHKARLLDSGDDVVIAMVPDDQSVGIKLIADATREASKAEFRKVFVIGFGFEANVKSEMRGKIEVILVNANRDLVIDELKASSGDQALTLVGEPEVELKKISDKEWQVTVLGYNVFDPMSRNVRQDSSPDKIDCWMIDTDYDDKSFFARRIHFPGKSNDRQISRFKKELGSRIDPRQWEYMESLTSAPIKCPEGKEVDQWRLAVRIITVHGEEMLTVIDANKALDSKSHDEG